MAGAARVARRKKMLKIMRDFFMEQGRVMDLSEYRNFSGVPLRRNQIMKYCRTWNIMLAMLHSEFPELEELKPKPQKQEKSDEQKT